jgi:hypothetical protein
MKLFMNWLWSWLQIDYEVVYDDDMLLHDYYYDMMMMFMLLNVIEELHAYYFWLCISPLLLENVALRMGSLQVTKISRGREWTPHKCVLGALIRNGMGILLLFSVPYVLL